MKDFFKKIFTKENLKKFFRTYIWLMVLVFVLDIVTKWVVVKSFGKPYSTTYNDKSNMIQIIKNFLYIGRTYNKGAAWSIGSSQTGKIVFIFISVILSAILIFAYVKNYKKLKTPFKVALALMIAGALGNLIDRAFYWEKTVGFTGVVDWISFHFGNYTFPMFNVADSSLVIGVIILFILVIIDSIREGVEKGKKGEYKYSPEELEKKQKEKENAENSSK